MQDVQHTPTPGVASAAPPRHLARYLSIVGHPFFVLPASVAVVSVLRGGDVRSGALLAALFLMVSAGIVVGMQTGRFNDFDVSERERRPGFYLWVTAGTAALAFWLRGDAQAVRASVCAGGLLVACGLINRWIKASLHTAFGLYAAGFWAAWSIAAGLLALPLVAAVAWSRLQLRRHTLPEVLVGAALGAVAGVALLLPAS